MFTSPQISSVKLLTPDCRVEPLGGGQVMKMGAALSKRPAELGARLLSIQHPRMQEVSHLQPRNLTGAQPRWHLSLGFQPPEL